MWTANPMTNVLIGERRERFNIHMHRPSQVKRWGLEWWIYKPGSAKDWLQPPETRNQRCTEQTLLGSLQQQLAADPLILGFWHPELWEKHFCYLTPSSVWWFAMETLGNKTGGQAFPPCLVSHRCGPSQEGSVTWRGARFLKQGHPQRGPTAEGPCLAVLPAACGMCFISGEDLETHYSSLFSVPQFSHLHNGNDNKNQLIRLLGDKIR